MNPHIFLCGTTAAIVQIPRGFSSDQWGHAQRSFCEKIHPKKSFLEAWDGCYQLYPDQKLGRVYWSEELAGAGGASFRLFPMADATEEEIVALTQKLRSDRDVVRLKVQLIKNWVTFKVPHVTNPPVFKSVVP